MSGSSFNDLDKGLPRSIVNCIKRCDIDIRKDLNCNIVLAGGGSMLPGLRERLQLDVESLTPGNGKISVLANPERKYASWLGGSVLSSLGSFSEMWASKQEYDEVGPSILRRKFY